MLKGGTNLAYLKDLILPQKIVPKLRDLGVKSICLINFDIVEGPIAFLFKVIKDSYLITEFEQNQSRLIEIYTGLSHTPIDILKIGNERVVASRFDKEKDGAITTSLLLFICKENALTEELERIAKASIVRSRGEPKRMPRAFEDAFKETGRTFVMYEREGKIREYTLVPGEKIVKTHDEFQNLHGLVLIDFERNNVDTRLVPNFIEGVKIEPVKIAKMTEEMMKEGVKRVNLTTWKDQNLYVISSSGRKAVLVVFSKTVLNEAIEEWLRSLMDVLEEKKIYADPELVMELIKYLESNEDLTVRNMTRKELIEIVLYSKLLLPSTLIKNENKEGIETPIEVEFFSDLIPLYKEMTGKETIYQISKKAGVNIGRLVDYLLLLKSRNLISLLSIVQ